MNQHSIGVSLTGSNEQGLAGRHTGDQVLYFSAALDLQSIWTVVLKLFRSQKRVQKSVQLLSCAGHTLSHATGDMGRITSAP